MEIIKYEIIGVAHGRQCITKCPHNQKNDFNYILAVGSVDCKQCNYFHSANTIDVKEVVCKYKDQVKKELVDRKIIVSVIMMDIKYIRNKLTLASSNLDNMNDQLDKMEQDILVLRDGE